MSHYDCNIRSASPAASAEKPQAHTMAEERRGHSGGSRHCSTDFFPLEYTDIYSLEEGNHTTEGRPGQITDAPSGDKKTAFDQGLHI